MRSALKGFTWRLVATSTTIAIAYIITGEVRDAFTIGGIEFVGKIFIYYLHERAWLLVPAGTFRRLVGIGKGDVEEETNADASN